MHDLISRQAAIDALGERPIIWSNDDEYSLGARNQYDTDKLAVETVPSAQPERKKGKWISFCRGKICNCSVCRKGYDNTYEFIEEWNYCPNCGADMRGEQE